MMVSEINDGEIQPPEREMWTKKNDIKDMRQTIEAYQGERQIVIPKWDSGQTLDASIVITEPATVIENRPIRSAPITLASGLMFDIKNTGAANWTDVSPVLKGLLIDGNGVATRAISTENTSDARSMFKFTVQQCRIDNMTAANSISLYMKNQEHLQLVDNILGECNGQNIRLEQAGTRQIGNQNIWRNYICLQDDFTSPSNAAVGITIEATGTSGAIGLSSSMGNQFYGTQNAVNPVAIEVIGKAGCTVGGIYSVHDRFEMCRMLTMNALGTIEKFDFGHFTNTSYHAAAAIYIIYLSTACTKVSIGPSCRVSTSASTHNDSAFLGNDSNGTNADAPIMHDMLGGWDKDTADNRSWFKNPDASGQTVKILNVYGYDGRCTDIP